MSGAGDRASSPAPAFDLQNDPFVRVATPLNASHHRFSNFDSQHFTFGPSASPTQAKRALEAHLAETDRRMEEAGKLGTALVQQRKDLADRLREVEKVEGEGGLSDELRRKLVEIEKDYNEVARESARAFLPKQRVPSNEAAAGSPFVPEGKGGRRSVSPSKFEGQATGSPTKFSVPNRKIRNQPANRVHDIEFAAEISTSLISQVRTLQGLLAEKEEELKDVKFEKSKLEYEAEGFQQRVKTLDESEHRYKDENWNLETQIHDLMAKERESADREKKLTQTLNVLQAEKNASQRELDELKVNHSKLSDDYASATKHHDIELGTAKRNIVIADSERAALRKKIDDLTGQNTELAKAVSASQRGRVIERESILGMSDEDFETANDKTTPEHSPPPSPVKGTPRHSMLESETLKTSLGHAQRTIQGLRNNVHREKTEKLELKRMLQEARDELEKLRHDPLAQNKRARKTDSKEFKKPPPRLLGGLRSSRSEIFSEDSNWEDQPDSTSPARSSLASRGSSHFQSVAEEPIGQVETANETSDAAFETAHEPATETDDFHTGAEEFSSDDAETETDSPTKRRTPGYRPGLPTGLTRSGSLHSTASTEDEEDYPFDREMRTPTSLPPPQHKFQVRLSEEPPFQSSPPSVASSSVAGTPQPVQSLAAELGDFDASDDESTMSATPSRSIRGRTVSPPPPVPRLPKVAMIDNGTMTDDQPESQSLGTGLDEDLEFSSVHAQGIKPISMPDTRVAELADLHNVYEKNLRDAGEEKAAAYAAALEELKSQHEEQLNNMRAETDLAHAEATESLKQSHAEEISKAVADIRAVHAQEIETLKSNHTDEVGKVAAEAQSTYAKELESLRSAHAEEISKAIADVRAAHAKELDALQSNHANEVTGAVSAAQTAHTQELDTLKSTHAEDRSEALAELRAVHAQELENQASQKQLDSNAAHAAELETLRSYHAEEIEMRESEIKAAHARELESLKAKHEDDRRAAEIAALVAAHSSQNVQSLQTEYAQGLVEAKQKASHSQQIEAHAKQIEDLKRDSDAERAAEMAALVASHGKQLESELATLKEAHAQEIDALETFQAAIDKQQIDALNAAHAESQQQALESLRASHDRNIEALKSENAAEALADLTDAHSRQLDDLRQSHHESAKAQLELQDLRQESESSKAAELATLGASHTRAIEALKDEHEAAAALKMKELSDAHAQELETLALLHEALQSQKLQELADKYQSDLEGHRQETLRSEALETLRATHQSTLDNSLESLKSNHATAMEDFHKQRDVDQAEALDALRVSHSRQLAQLQKTAKAEHATLLESYDRENASEKEKLLADHAAELEALRSSVGFEPVEASELRNRPRTPVGGRRGGKVSELEIAEDDTRQSPNAAPGPETPESQRPFKEISANSRARPSQRPAIHTAEQSSQTALTSDGLDRLLKHKGRDTVTITTARGEVTVTPFDDAQRADDTASVRRPGSSSSARASALNRPPLPANHREVIEAALNNPAGGGKGAMGPPLVPASSYKTPGSRPETPSNVRPMSPGSFRGASTSRGGRATMPGHGDVHFPARMPLHSRKSSMSSFASEIDTRFNRAGMGMDAATFGPGADPRMIQAITQTMIGEYLWKYTRKAGRGEMSENRHRRYFWVHPYTKTLYWSDRDPSTAGRSELKAKSIPIEAVRVVGDDNIMPPGLHRKSLVIISPGRSVKFTCTTGQRHETWFNALSYLLLRTGNENQADGEDMGQITQEDVDEFNPSMNRRPINGNRTGPPPSLLSYNSRLTYNNDVSLSIPTLSPTRETQIQANRSTGTLGRLSGYLKTSTINSTFSSLRSRSHLPQESTIYGASEVADSAEDLRQMIEQQDQASDRLENVRACCDGKHANVALVDIVAHTNMSAGKHDVGTLSHTKRGPGTSEV
ncbi:hypothetical protein GGR52DRAFT_580566 [Hypoxylon sp. FL1284]|nr:hypothetical protein GGR52DRAFT_580566 [Hypoxylon sp. FL1284]